MLIADQQVSFAVHEAVAVDHPPDLVGQEALGGDAGIIQLRDGILAEVGGPEGNAAAADGCGTDLLIGIEHDHEPAEIKLLGNLDGDRGGLTLSIALGLDII